MPNKRVAFQILGCKVNQNEADAMQNLFRKAGYQRVAFNQEADVYVIHTCTVTHLGDRKSRQMIRRATRLNPKAVVAVTGCYAQVASEEISQIPGVDLLIGTQARAEIVNLVEKIMEDAKPMNQVKDILFTREFEELPLEQPGRARAFMKIQEGCRNFCTYCIIPFARGPERSRQPEKILAETKTLLEQGYKELVLTGICTGAYGKDLGEGIDLNWLLNKLEGIPGLKRVRISSLDPNDFTLPLLETLTSASLFCSHLHISLQSGNDEVLKRMGRNYNTIDFTRLVEKLRKRRPEIGITTDIMVGFPGETDREHKDSLAFVERLNLAGLHVFKYSPRQGTKAAQFPNQVSAQAKEARSQEFIALGKNLAQDYGKKFLGQYHDVLVENEVDDGIWEGHTDNYLKIRFLDDEDLRGEIVPVLLEKLDEEQLLGRRLKDLKTPGS